MSGQIFQPNLTDPGRAGHIQRGWQFSPTACNRPPADFHLPIICVGYGPSDVSNTTFTKEEPLLVYQEFSDCCPSGPAVNNTVNVYTIQRQCGTPVCFTQNEDVAKGWDECVKNKTLGMFEKWKGQGNNLSNATKPEDAFGRCEYIDYAALKKGILKSGEEKSAAFSVKMVLIIGFGAMLVAGGLF